MAGLAGNKMPKTRSVMLESSGVLARFKRFNSWTNDVSFHYDQRASYRIYRRETFTLKAPTICEALRKSPIACGFSSKSAEAKMAQHANTTTKVSHLAHLELMGIILLLLSFPNARVLKLKASKNFFELLLAFRGKRRDWPIGLQPSLVAARRANPRPSQLDRHITLEGTLGSISADECLSLPFGCIGRKDIAFVNHSIRYTTSIEAVFSKSACTQFRQLRSPRSSDQGSCPILLPAFECPLPTSDMD